MPVKTSQAGFTLVEMIAGIVVFGVVLGIIATIIIPQSRQGFDPMWQIRATELSQSLINEINAKAFDQQSDFIGGRLDAMKRLHRHVP